MFFFFKLLTSFVPVKFHEHVGYREGFANCQQQRLAFSPRPSALCVYPDFNVFTGVLLLGKLLSSFSFRQFLALPSPTTHHGFSELTAAALLPSVTTRLIPFHLKAASDAFLGLFGIYRVRL